MKSFTAHIKRVSLALVALSSVGVMQGAWAIGTDAGISISNTATVDYDVNGIDQPDITSSAASFTVDHKVDLTVAAGSNTPTQPNATQVRLPFTVTNDGNKADSFTLSIQSISGAFTPTGAYIWVDADADNVIDAGEVGTGTDLSASNTVALAEDATTTVWIVATSIPGTATNGQTADLMLRATTVTTNDDGAADTVGEDVVWADDLSNGYEEDNNLYVISTAAVTVTKSATLISDPINGTAADRKYIPGSVVEYTITVTNPVTSGQAADNIVVTDAIPAAMAYSAGTITKVGGSAAAPTDAAIVGNALTVSVGSLAVNSTATITFRVTIL